jgi:hypothetical protein
MFSNRRQVKAKYIFKTFIFQIIRFKIANIDGA